jgi:sugar phosphate isomerase/epimerase
MKLAAGDFSWPLLSHEKALDLVKLLDFDGLDICLAGNRSQIKPEDVRGDIPYWAGVLGERLHSRGLELADFFFLPWTDFETLAPNHPDAAVRAESREYFAEMLDLAARLGASGMTILPGTLFGDEDAETSIARSAEELGARVHLARERGLRLSVEGHLGSNVDTPTTLGRLLELTPGLELALDYGHFTYQGIADDDIEPLLEHARHFHCRGGATGKLQAIWEENTIDYPRIIRKLQENGYDGWFAIEYVWTDWGDCNRTENVCETIRMRDMARATLAGEDYSPAEKSI